MNGELDTIQNELDEVEQKPKQEGKKPRDERVVVTGKPEVAEQPQQRPTLTADMYASKDPSGRPSMPTRVKLCKEWIDEFNRTCHRTAADTKKRGCATNGFMSVLRSLDTLNKEDTHEVMKYLIDTIRSSETGAFDRTVVFANGGFLDNKEREVFFRMVHLLTTLVETRNLKRFRDRADPSYALSLYTSPVTRANIDSFLPQ